MVKKKVVKNKVCFSIDAETDKQVKALPRSFNLSAELRHTLTQILKK
jgi:hypothetical protein